MATTTYNTIFKLKRGNASDFTSQNPVLAEGEPGFELDTNLLKIGNGSSSWNNLSYIQGGVQV